MAKYVITTRSLCDDQVINDFLEILSWRSEGVENSISLYCFPTMCFTAVDKGGHTNVARWTKKIRITNYDIVLFPVHEPLPNRQNIGTAHWYLIAVFLKEKLIRSHDSLGREHPTRLVGCLNYIEWEYARLGCTINKNDWRLKGNSKELPLQQNKVDCGFFVYFYAMCLSKGSDPSRMKYPQGVEMRKFVSSVLRRGKADPLDGIVNTKQTPFPGPAVTYSEVDLLEGLDRQMKDVTDVLGSINSSKERPTSMSETGESKETVDMFEVETEGIHSFEDIGKTKTNNEKRRHKKPRMMRRTIVITLKNGSKKRVNVKKLGLQVYKPYG